MQIFGDIMSKINETSEQRFKRLARLRTNQIIDKLRVLGNCSNHQVYKYSKEDVEKMFSTIEKKVRETKLKFNHFEEDEKFEF